MKGKKILVVFLSILFFGVSSFALASCDLIPSVEPTVEPHVHEWDEGEITKEATCITNGEKTYKCSGCEKIKVDVITATGHTEVVDAAVAPTCTETGLTEGKHCDECGLTLVYQQTLVATGHTEATDAAVAPTCTETGLTEGKHCSTCDEVLVAQEVVEALGHTEVIDEVVAPTCLETGLTEGKHCSTCHEVLVAQEVVEALGHNYVDYVCSECGYNYYTDGLEFSLLEDGISYKVSGYNGIDNVVIIPKIYNDKPVTSIGECAFEECSSLTSITIPDSVIRIEYNAFQRCSALKSVTIGNSVTSIGQYAFSACSSLSNITIPNSVTNIGEFAFFSCSSLTSIVIPDGVTSIGSQTFYDCKSLTTVNIGYDVTSIGNHAFYNCRSLTTVYYSGIKEQWNDITIGTANSYLLNANVICHIHDTNNVLEKIEATCLGEDGKITYYCETCNKNYSVIIPAGHDYVNAICSKCGEVKPLNSLLGFDELEDNTLVADVLAIVTYIIPNYVFVQDVNGINTMLYRPIGEVSIGDTIIINGYKTSYAKNNEFAKGATMEVITGNLELDIVPPIEVTADNVNEVLVLSNNHAVFKLKNAVVLEINPTGNSKLLLGNTEVILRNAEFPNNVDVGDTVDVICVMYRFVDSIQLRVCNVDDIIKH